MSDTRHKMLVGASLVSLVVLVAFTAGCSSEDKGVACQPALPGSCGAQSAYCAPAGQCVPCPQGFLDCDGSNANLCETQGATCGGGSCASCGAPSCCQNGGCYPDGQACGSGGLTCSNGSCQLASNCGGVACSAPSCCYNNLCYPSGQACGSSGQTCSEGRCGSSVCGNVSCASPSCCHDGVCYPNGQLCGGAGLTCNSGTCGIADDCGGISCGPPSCCHNNTTCYQEGQSCGPGLACKAGSCSAASCGGATCGLPACCYANVCTPDGQPCGTSGQTCSNGVCGPGPAWSCTLEPGGGTFSNPHSDGCRWKWSCPTEGNRELYCETVSTAEHTCSCRKDGVEEMRFKSVPICTYVAATIATQANAECGWKLPTP